MLILKENTPKYWNFIREVRSDPRNEAGFLEKVQITEEQQKKYMEKHNDKYRVCVDYLEGIDYEIPVGFIGSVDGDIRLGVVFKEHGRGIATFMLNEFKKLIDPNVDVAKVLHSNSASNKLFQSCGFTLYREDDDFKYYRIYEL